MKKMSGVSGSKFWMMSYVLTALAMVAMLVACVTGKVVRIANGTLATIVVLLLLCGVVGCFCKAKALWKQLRGTTAPAAATPASAGTVAPAPAPATPASAGTSTTATPPAPAGKKLSRRYLEAWRAQVEDSLVEANEILTEAEEAEDEYKSAKLEYEAKLAQAKARRQQP